ncbi:MAG TPA: hypothetical protein VKW76_16835 [Candidatus Binatia bacterium]|nr:hypothetical protein [Candidatus Binatia bacterium]
MGGHPDVPRPDPDGVRVLAASPVRRAARLLGLAVALVGVTTVGMIVAIRLAPAARPAEVVRETAAPERGVPAAAEPPAPPPAPAVDTRAAAHVERARPPGSPGQPAAMVATAGADDGAAHEDVPFTFGEPGTGIQAFPPPGTKPIKRGIVVPDGFELPPGYVRHYQTTDDGQQLPPILMFSPDYTFVDANGKPVAVPADRVVPPSMAPPGLPMRMLDVPAPQGASGPAR